MTQSNLITTYNYQQFSAEERGQIQALYKDNYSTHMITARLCRNPATINREFKRGTVRQLSTNYLSFYRYFAEADHYQNHRLNCHTKSLLKRC